MVADEDILFKSGKIDIIGYGDYAVRAGKNFTSSANVTVENKKSGRYAIGAKETVKVYAGNNDPINSPRHTKHTGDAPWLPEPWRISAWKKTVREPPRNSRGPFVKMATGVI